MEHELKRKEMTIPNRSYLISSFLPDDDDIDVTISTDLIDASSASQIHLKGLINDSL